MAEKQLFGVFSPVLGEKKDFPVILLDKTVQTDNRNIYRKYGEVHRRLMRLADMLDSGEVKSQTPDGFPILQQTQNIQLRFSTMLSSWNLKVVSMQLTL